MFRISMSWSLYGVRTKLAQVPRLEFLRLSAPFHPNGRLDLMRTACNGLRCVLMALSLDASER